MFTRVAIVGCGLVGGSFALALRAADPAARIVGFDRDPGTAERARALGIVERIEARLEDAVADADLVMIAAPVAQSPSIFRSIAEGLATDAIVSDVGSTKCGVIDAARAALGDRVARFVPGHPIAGRETHGPEAASGDLFRGRRVLLTPLAENDEASIARIERTWQACGARVERIDPAVHDAVLSAVSHLPHLLAYALVAQIADAPDAERKFGLAGSGFRDFTRIAASSPEMWRDIALANRDALLKDLDEYGARIDALRSWLEARDADALETLFERARIARAAWHQDS